MNYDETRISILDDEAIFAFSIEYYLNKAGFSNISKFETSEALFLDMSTPPDVLILDHFLNNELGLEVLVRIKKTHPEVKVIYLSAQKTVEIANRAIELGAVKYLEKGVSDIQEIIEVIKSEQS